MFPTLSRDEGELLLSLDYLVFNCSATCSKLPHMNSSTPLRPNSTFSGTPACQDSRPTPIPFGFSVSLVGSWHLHAAASFATRTDHKSSCQPAAHSFNDGAWLICRSRANFSLSTSVLRACFPNPFLNAPNPKHPSITRTSSLKIYLHTHTTTFPIIALPTRGHLYRPGL